MASLALPRLAPPLILYLKVATFEGGGAALPSAAINNR